MTEPLYPLRFEPLAGAAGFVDGPCPVFFERSVLGTQPEPDAASRPGRRHTLRQLRFSGEPFR